MSPVTNVEIRIILKDMARSSRILHLLRWALALVAAFYVFILLGLVALKWINPPFTSVQLQQSPFRRKYRFVPLSRISPNLQHAVIAAEDSRFYLHHGFDWEEIKDAITDDLEDGRVRGASTISQQLVKNLFLSNGGSFIRKAIEATIVPFAERILSKQRILELYLNVIEWGPGIYGAEAAAAYHYKTSAAHLDRDQSARMAAVLPSPRRRTPVRMDKYSAIILQRMTLMGW